MSKRSRDRQLAKLAARRQAERDAATRRRNLIVGAVAGVLALVVVVVGLGFLLGDDGDVAAPTASPSASPTGSASPSPAPGTQTGTVTPTAANSAVSTGYSHERGTNDGDARLYTSSGRCVCSASASASWSRMSTSPRTRPRRFVS